MIPAEMNAVEIASFGGPEVLKPARRPVPQPGPGEVLIKVAAAGINRPDVLQRQGGYAPPPGASDLPGLEVAGEIVAMAADVTGWRIGDRVTALVSGGGYAEYCTAPAPQVLPVPAGFDMVLAAAVPETFFTVWTNVFERGQLRPGETFLVHGGSSGIGTTAIQLAHHFGARVIATVGSDDKAKACRDLGADLAINYRAQDFVAEVMAATQKKGADLILDMVGGDYINRNLSCLALDGRLVMIAFLQGSKAEVNFAQVMMKRQTITGSTLRPRSVAQKGAIAAALREKVWPLLEGGQVKPVLYRTFPLAEAAAAHALMESSAHTGKIVLTIDA
ncbi:putative PIG3 family NAD(P)H quinone oxidoreductase [Dongia mobilis]|uniref:Putative PIG3 family NAD(P)H quinone oxidoreductase n=1 Tax=Dongia mobilis TaxID=578943 RepID=A0A4R6WW18_9PROT|nr:NAD(P)H-quinone oxidoreductase [Dongia mobilis]TDQ84234.1 putative PIG3 family NAD(P)H quinone oxidoreductase [Dongia mobilis]